MEFKPSFRVYEGSGILQVSEEKTKPLVQDFLYEDDFVILMAKQKEGKSLVALQLMCNLSTGSPFLDTFEIPNPVRVWYFALEGKDNDTKRRMVHMTHKLKCDTNMVKIFCCDGIQFNTKVGMIMLSDILSKYKDELPRVIIIDPLYQAMAGSLSDDAIVRDFISKIRILSHICNASVIILHHSKRPFRLQDGTTKELGDEELFGSVFWKASVDHIFYMGAIGTTGNKFVKCDTQRSGDIVDMFEMKLHQPNPLYWEKVNVSTDVADKVAMLMQTRRVTVQDIMETFKLSRVSVYENLKKLSVTKTATRPVMYGLEGVKYE
jgi:hypothetical protein